MPRSVADLKEEAKRNIKKTLTVFNPSFKDFTVIYQGEPVTIKSLEMRDFPFDVANHVVKHLSNDILNERGVRNNPEDDLKGIRKQILFNDE